jgi:hypothetical protein
MNGRKIVDDLHIPAFLSIGGIIKVSHSPHQPSFLVNYMLFDEK